MTTTLAIGETPEAIPPLEIMTDRHEPDESATRPPNLDRSRHSSESGFQGTSSPTTRASANPLAGVEQAIQALSQRLAMDVAQGKDTTKLAQQIASLGAILNPAIPATIQAVESTLADTQAERNGKRALDRLRKAEAPTLGHTKDSTTPSQLAWDKWVREVEAKFELHECTVDSPQRTLWAITGIQHDTIREAAERERKNNSSWPEIKKSLQERIQDPMLKILKTANRYWREPWEKEETWNDFVTRKLRMEAEMQPHPWTEDSWKAKAQFYCSKLPLILLNEVAKERVLDTVTSFKEFSSAVARLSTYSRPSDYSHKRPRRDSPPVDTPYTKKSRPDDSRRSDRSDYYDRTRKDNPRGRREGRFERSRPTDKPQDRTNPSSNEAGKERRSEEGKAQP